VSPSCFACLTLSLIPAHSSPLLAGATVQIILFAILAIEIKRKCPAIHTMLEVVHSRWGKGAHLTFLFFGLLASLIVTAMLILGGAATINALTGIKHHPP